MGTLTRDHVKIRGLATGTATAGDATVNSGKGMVTTDSLTTAAGGQFPLTVRSGQIDANTVVLATVKNGTNNQGSPVIGRINVNDGSSIIRILNTHATEAFNGTLIVCFVAF